MMASTTEVILGKLLPSFVVITLQMILLFVIGDLVLGLSSKGSMAELVILAPALAICVLALTFALVAFCATMSQLDALGNLLMLVSASLGGALALTATLPGWAQSIAPAIPSHWAMQASTQRDPQGRRVRLGDRGRGHPAGSRPPSPRSRRSASARQTTS